MSGRPRCIVATVDAPAIAYRPVDGAGVVECRVRPLSDMAGLTRMGVKIRETPPGRSGTHLHYHDTEEEWAYVLAGRGRLRLGRHTIPVRAGSFAGLPAGPSPHCFVAEGEAPLVVIEGGERRPDEETCTYPELGVQSHRGLDTPIDVDALPPPTGRPEQVVHVDDVPERERPHPLTPAAVRHFRPIDERTGLTRQACAWVRLEPGIESTTYHTHDRTDEWVYILSGELDVRIGDGRYVVRAGDFVAHPAGGPAHAMRARTGCTYLMGGESRPDDIVTYPERGMTLGPKGFEKIET